MKNLRPHEIQSADNAIFKLWLTLLTSKGIKKQGQFLLSGKKLISEFLNNKQTPSSTNPSNFIIKGEIRHPQLEILTPETPQYILSLELFQQLDTLGTHHNLLLIAFPKMPLFNFQSPPDHIEVISPLGDPLNLGALARSCLAFGVKTLILTQESCHPFLPKAIKASSGALLALNIYQAPSLPEIIGMNFPIYALDAQGQSLRQIQFPKHLRFLLGEEGPGLPQASNLQKIRIETQNVESLNAAVAGSLFLFHLQASYADT